MKAKVREAISAVEDFFKTFCGAMPYFHVSDGIGNEKQNKDIFEGKFHGYIRLGCHPDHVALEKQLIEMEGGAVGRVCSDGMGAVIKAIEPTLSYFMRKKNLKKARVIIIRTLYGGSDDAGVYLDESLLYNVEVKFLYSTDPNLLKNLRKAITKNTVLIFFENPGNPTLPFVDAKGIVKVARSTQAKPKVACDNTFGTGFVHPFEWGVDIIVNSGTKYIAGASSWSLGFITLSKGFYAEHPDCWKEMFRWSCIHGGTLGPFEAFMTHTFSMADFPERIRQHSRNALVIARMLERHPLVERVIYPGLDSYEYKKNFKSHVKPIDGEMYYGGMIYFYIKGASEERTNKFLFYLNNNTSIPNKASLAGDVSSIESAYSLSHKGLSAEDKAKIGITPNSVRFSTGLEPPIGVYQELSEALYATE
ncbi:MAG: PLP-dependent transferase [bacterium]|nr:PLP-dependent transferase [bacterium]